MTTPICSRLNERLRDRRGYFSNWLFLWHHIGREDPIEIDMFNGRTARFNLTGFSGTAHTLYWEAIVRGIRREVIEQFSIVEAEARSYALGTALRSIDESAGALISFVRVTRRDAVAKDALLRRNGDLAAPEADRGHWDDLSDGAILRQADAIKVGLQELLSASQASSVLADPPHLTNVDIARRQMLFALVIAHNLGSSSYRDLKVVNETYNIRMPASLVASSISPWVSEGWVKKSATLDGKISALLTRDHYGDALQFIMEWIGATSLTINGEKEGVVCDIGPPTNLRLPDGWSWFQAIDDEPLALAPGADRMVSLNHNDPSLERITEALGSAIEAVRGDNDLERRDEILSSLRYVRSLLDRAELSILQLRVGVPMALEDASKLAGAWAKIAMIETVKAAVVDWVRKTFGI